MAFPLLGALSGVLPPGAIPHPAAVRAPAPDDHVIVAPLLGRTGAYLTVRDAASRVQVTLTTLPGQLYRITTPAGSGLAPAATVHDGHAEVRFRATGQDGPDVVRVVLNRDVRWDLRLPAGAGEQQLNLAGGRITRLDVGGSGLIEAALPEPRGTVPVTLEGGVGRAVITAPTAPLRIGLADGAGSVVVPWTIRAAAPGGSVLAEPGWAATPHRYAISFRGGLGSLTVRRG